MDTCFFFFFEENQKCLAFFSRYYQSMPSPATYKVPPKTMSKEAGSCGLVSNHVYQGGKQTFEWVISYFF